MKVDRRQKWSSTRAVPQQPYESRTARLLDYHSTKLISPDNKPQAFLAHFGAAMIQISLRMSQLSGQVKFMLNSRSFMGRYHLVKAYFSCPLAEQICNIQHRSYARSLRNYDL